MIETSGIFAYLEWLIAAIESIITYALNVLGLGG